MCEEEGLYFIFSSKTIKSRMNMPDYDPALNCCSTTIRIIDKFSCG